MKATVTIVCTIILVMLIGCQENEADSRIRLDPDVGSSSLTSNVITKPVTDLVNIILGKGIVITEVKTRRNQDGFLVVQVRGVNESVAKRLFEHKTEWLDVNGFVLDTVTDNWMPVSAPPTSEFIVKIIAPRREAFDYRINTRVDKKTK